MRLADGRELIYFDDTPGAQRRLDDPRDLPPATTLSELRYDAVLDEWVTVASHRQGRTHLPPADQCPLCPSRDGRETEIPSDDYDVIGVVVIAVVLLALPLVEEFASIVAGISGGLVGAAAGFAAARAGAADS